MTLTNTNLSDVQQALINARVIQQHWVDGGWEALSNELEEKLVTDNEVLDIYPLVEVDTSVTITIKLSNKIYSVPLEDVSPLSINDCLVIGVSDLYPDWEERILSKLVIPNEVKPFTKDNENWSESIYLDVEGISRIVKAKVV
jgi:hypothetical protein